MGESERRYQQLIRTSPAPINLFDASGEIIWGNDAVLDLLGLDSREELIGRSIFEFIDPEDRYTAESELAEVVENREPMGPTRMRLTRADGEERTIRVATAPGQYDGADIGQAVVIDVTELDRTQDALEAEREFIDTALDTLEDVFYVIDSAGTLERWNEALVEVSGYAPAEVDSMAVEDFFVEEHVDRVSDSISRCFVEGSDTIEAIVQTKSGEQIPFEFRKQRFVRDNSRVAVVGIGRNITQRKSQEQHLRTVDYLLQHHLRNQLNVIQGNVDLLAERVEDSDGPQVSAVHDATEKMLSLFDHHQDVVDQLLVKTERDRLDVAALLDDLIAEARARHPGADITLTGPDSAPVVATPQIEQAFTELLQNALVHNDAETPVLDVTIDTDSTPVTITFVDNGPLISRREYEFMEESTALDSTSHPTGLGLWSVNLAVKHSRGTLTVEEADNGGNRVLVELPTPVDDWE